MARPADNLLASTIALPQNTTISYALFKPDSTCISPHDSIEQARRSILSRNPISCTILDALLTSIHIGTEPFIYVFNIAAQSLDSLHFDGLAVAERSSLSPPSVSLCVGALSACLSILTISIDRLLPNADKRNAYSHFLEAVRSRIIDDIVAASMKSLGSRQVKRFKNGFLMSQPSSISDSEYKVIARPLIFCQLQVHFSFLSTGVLSHLAIHPMLLPTPFQDISQSLPLPPGTPITLLPYGTPAFFLACYTGPTTGLIKQFRLSLQGMGSGEWESPSRSPSTSNMDNPVSDDANQNCNFIIGWIKVENKQGEDKGITIIYPTSLCLSYIPLSTPRAPLDYIPELPVPLQPSPQASTVIPSVSAVIQSGPPATASSTGNSAVFHPYRPSFVTSPTSESLHCFRALMLSKSRDLQQVAAEVGGYVDAVARERERERERLKREREGGPSSSPKLARTTATAPTPMAVDVTTTSAPVSLATQVSPLIIPGSSQQHLQPPMAVQNFYPSPPQSNPIVVSTSDGKASPVVDSTAPFSPAVEMSTTTTAVLAPPLPIASSTSGSSNGYDPFGSMDTTWTQPTQNYLGMEIDMDFGIDDMGMNFGLNMASVSNSSGSRGPYNDSRGHMEFEAAFTDDDFSFFDRPSRAAAVIAPPTFTQSRIASGSGTHPLSVSSLPARTARSPPPFGDINLPGPGLPNHSHSSSHNQQIWTPGGFMEGFTPRSVDHNDSIPPDLLPSSPGQTPDSHSAPATPNVHLEDDTAIKRPSTSNLFEPIPFAPYHRAADGKYAFGKFALPSPPAEDDLAESASISLPSSPNGANSLRCHYDAITDPRIGVVRKLIGVKRKTTFNQGIRSPPKKSPWVRAHEEWEKPASEKDDEPEVKSDLESDGDEEDLDDIDSPLMSRPTTPTPSYLPLGPTLLHMQFQHSQLLPLSTSLRPPGAAVAPINLVTTNTPLSVPTPVSPAAMMGQASEKSKSLEAAAFAVAAEVVENPIWAETWRANIVGAKLTPTVWPTDIKAVNQLLGAVPSLEAPVDMTSLFGLDTSNLLQALETPMISIGKGDAVIHVLPTALRFWEKLGLGPKGGRKDLSAFVVFEEDGEQRQTQMDNWLVSVGNAYQRKHFGSLSPGKSGVCPKDGLVPLRLDSSFRKSLSSFMSSLTPPQPTLIVFLVLPVTVMTLSSPILRQILSASKKVLSGFTESQIVFEFVPEQFISSSMEKSSPYDSALDLLSSSVYNRILVPVDRTMARRIHEYGEPTRSYFMSPTFTLSRPLYNKVSYVRAAHTSLDIMDRYTLLHVAYHLTACGKWILASCVDQRGEAYDLRVWLTQSPGASDGELELSDEEYAVRKVWDFAMQFAKKANVEWRVVFARLGVMNEQEMSAWTTQLTVHVLTSREQPPLHHSVVCVEPDASWLFIPSSKPNVAPLQRSSPPTRSSPSSPKHHSVFTDISATTYALFPSNHMSISLPPSHADLGLSQSFIPEPALTSLPPSPVPQTATHLTTNTVAQTMSTISPSVIIPDNYSSDTCSRPHPITLMPLSTTTLIRVPVSSSLASIRMTHIHLLRTFHSYSYTHSSQVSSCPVPDDQQLHRDITKNYHELAILAKVRWKLDGNSLLPFHLAAVDAMRMSLDRDWDRLEVGGVS